MQQGRSCSLVHGGPASYLRLVALILVWKSENAFTLSVYNSGKSFFNISMTFGIRARIYNSIIGIVLALMLIRDTIISVLYIA